MTLYGKVIVYKGIGAVVYRVPKLENHRLPKISHRSLGSEDTTTVSQVRPSVIFQQVYENKCFSKRKWTPCRNMEEVDIRMLIPSC